MKKIKVKGLEIDLDKIENPKLKRIVIREREFFFFGPKRREHEDHTETQHSEHSEHSDHRDYDIYWKDNYVEHSDYA